jgi:hypothetical protein
MPSSAEFFGPQAARGDLNLRNSVKIARPQTPKAMGEGSGMTICSPQSTSVAFPPNERSARNNVHVPFGSVPFNELNSRSQIPTHYQDATGRHPSPAGRKKRVHGGKIYCQISFCTTKPARSSPARSFQVTQIHIHIKASISDDKTGRTDLIARVAATGMQGPRRSALQSRSGNSFRNQPRCKILT